ncbi:transmembrane protease serine 9-like [Ptychodera flava]|uniref:transmembrane protease serine 9-like n=1 Tax=Ptychodera flava TaxID=63121 RepID=UPI00396AAE32
MNAAVTTVGRRLFNLALTVLLIGAVCEGAKDGRYDLADVSGRYLELKCPRGDPRVDPDWTKDNLPIYVSKAYTESRLFHLHGGNLLLVDTKESDSGTYTCTRHNGESSDNDVDIQNSDLEDVCGTQTLAPIRQRIFGGARSRTGEWPWMAMIRKTDTGEYCGGTLLNHYWVVTSALCVHSFSLTPGNTKVHLGKINRQVGESSEVVADVAKIVVYPEYDRQTIDGDVALIRLKTLVQFNNAISPICLPPVKTAEKIIGDRKAGWIAGWGRTEAHPFSSSLQKVKLKVTRHSTCVSSHDEHPVTSNMFCADSDFYGRDTCSGDNGGPFMRQIGTRWYLFGIVSWGLECAGNKPSVFTRVDKFHDWIREVQRNAFSCHDTNAAPTETTVEEIITSPISSDECGWIENGKSTPDNWPWMVQIARQRARLAYPSKCNGVLINKSWVVSLASCFPAWIPAQLTVKFTDPASPHANAREYFVERAQVHPEYNEYTRDYDMVLLKLVEPVEYTESVKPACLLKPNISASELEDQAQGFVTGVGNVRSLEHPTHDTVQTIPFAVDETESCNEIFFGGVGESMFCATTMSPTDDACGGFRGSPMVTQISGRWFALGLVSWGHLCHENPVVFSKLHSFHEWIADTLSDS